jgi:hypothetical protein
MDINTFRKLANKISDAVILRDFEKFDLFEQASLLRAIERGQTLTKAVEVYINSVEGDYSQLSKGMREYVPKKEIKRK